MKDAPDMDDAASFMVEFVSHQRRIFGYIGSLLPASNDNEDVYQQTCMALWRKRHSYDPARPFFAWACGFARNEVLRHVRKSARIGAVHLSEKLLDELELLATPEGMDAAADELRHAALETCLGRIHERQRALVERCYQGVESIRNVAAEMMITPAALTMRLQRIRHTLLKCIEKTLASE